jgi:catechol 2,3-dioxygenase-like lactoylglutathione lyase family enzyme
MCSVNVRSLQHVQVNVPEAAAAEARRFYGDLLGLLEIERPRSLSDAGRKGIWYRIGEEIGIASPIAGRERFFTRDPGGNRIEFLSFSA